MALSSQVFPPRKRRPSAGSFIYPNALDSQLVHSITLQISSIEPLPFLLKPNSFSSIRISKLLAVLFEDLLRTQVLYSPSTILCFEEMYIVLHRAKTLIEDSSNGSRMWLLIHIQAVATNFHELVADISTLLDILPVEELDLSQDVEEIVILLRKHCAESRVYVDPRDVDLQKRVFYMLDGIKSEIVPDPSDLKEIFKSLSLFDSSKCKDEIQSLEEEIQNEMDKKSRWELIAMIGLVRYGKCVLYWSSPPVTEVFRFNSTSNMNIPMHFRCPISLELMRDPVVVATGNTYDRAWIKPWIYGHRTCPITYQPMAHFALFPNRALKNLIAMWCREMNIPLETAVDKPKVAVRVPSKTGPEVTKMMVLFLINKLKTNPSLEAANRVVHELGALAKTDSVSRVCIAKAGGIPLLVPYLSSKTGLESPNLQLNAVTTLLNLSILEANKTKIVKTDGVLNSIIEVLHSGATWEAKGNSAAAIFSIAGVHSYRKRLGSKTRVIKGLIDLAKEGPTNSKKEALVAILCLAADRETIVRFVEGGVIESATKSINDLTEEAVAVIEAMVIGGGLIAVSASYKVIKKLCEVLRTGSLVAKESALAALVTICKEDGWEMVEAVAGIDSVIYELMGMVSVRARDMAHTLFAIVKGGGWPGYCPVISQMVVDALRPCSPSDITFGQKSNKNSLF